MTEQPDMSSGLTTADDHTAVERLLDYLRQPSVSTTGEGFPAATERAAHEMVLAGLQPTVLDTPGRPAVFGKRTGPPGAPTVLIYGHYDVQPTGPVDLWRTDPWSPVVADGRIWARGAGDNKGQHFAHLQALRNLLEADGGYPCTVKMILDGEEEMGSPNLAALVAERRELLDADLVIWSDGPVHESGRWCVLHGVRGVLLVKLTAKGSRQALHSGAWGNVAENPAWTLVQALASLRSPAGEVTVPGFYDDVPPLTPAERAAFDELPFDLPGTLESVGISGMDEGYGDLDFFGRVGGIPSLTINGVEAGDLSRTIIPHEATARLDIRLVGGQDPDRVFECIRAHLARTSPKVEVEIEGAVPASRMPLDNPWSGHLAAAVSRATGEEPLLIPAYGGTLPDFVWTSVLGRPSLGLPFANVDEANHAPNENIAVDRYLSGIAISTAVLRTLGSEEALRT